MEHNSDVEQNSEDFITLYLWIQELRRQIPNRFNRNDFLEEEISNITKPVFKQLDEKVEGLLREHKVSSLDAEFVSKVNKEDCVILTSNEKNHGFSVLLQKEIFDILKAAVTNNEADLAFNSAAFRQAQIYNPDVTGLLIAESIREIIQSSDTLPRLESLLKSNSLSVQLSNLNDKNIVPIVEVMTDLAYSVNRGRKIGGNQGAEIIEVILDNNVALKEKLSALPKEHPSKLLIESVLDEYAQIKHGKDPKVVEAENRAITLIEKSLRDAEERKNARKWMKKQPVSPNTAFGDAWKEATNKKEKKDNGNKR